MVISSAILTAASADRHRDNEVSHIVTGYWWNSAANGKIRVDEVYDGAFGSSMFDFTNSSDGSALNKQYLIGPNVGSTPSCFVGQVSQPGFPLLTADLLQSTHAVYGGIVQDQWAGQVTSVSRCAELRKRCADPEVASAHRRHLSDSIPGHRKQRQGI